MFKELKHTYTHTNTYTKKKRMTITYQIKNKKTNYTT